MLPPEQIDLINIQLQRVYITRGCSLQATEDIIKAINLAGYKLVKEVSRSQVSAAFERAHNMDEAVDNVMALYNV